VKKKHKPKPNFLIIGAAKAGTVSLTTMLRSHPEAGIVLGDQPNFFSVDDKYQLGWVKYLRLFEHCLGKKAIGDTSRSYSRIRYYPEVVSRIREHIPQARIIYMVRHPLQRMVSAYVEHMGYPNPPDFASISEAVRKEPMILDSSRYWEVFDAYRQKFDEARIKVVWFEEYTADPDAVFRDVCRFLEISDRVAPDFSVKGTDPRTEIEESSTNVSSSGVPLVTEWDETTRNWVLEQIREDNTRLLQHFGKPKDYWGDLFPGI
jgi:hypothetical protein